MKSLLPVWNPSQLSRCYILLAITYIYVLGCLVRLQQPISDITFRNHVLASKSVTTHPLKQIYDKPAVLVVNAAL